MTTMMVCEHEYLRERIGIIAKQIGDPDPIAIVETVPAVRAEAADPGTEHFRRLYREMRLLCYLQLRAPEGQVLCAAEEWRRSLGVRLYDHRQKYLQEQDAYDAWCQLPPPLRACVPEPPVPPELWVTDRDGHKWLINDRLLIVLDEIIRNLKKWRNSA